MTVLRLTMKGQKVGSGPVPGNPCLFPHIVGITLHALACEITQSIKKTSPNFRVFCLLRSAYTVYGVCFSIYKPASYLSLCLSLNFFCDETWRTKASLSPETGHVISMKRLWVSVPSESCGFTTSPLFFSPQAFGSEHPTLNTHPLLSIFPCFPTSAAKPLLVFWLLTCGNSSLGLLRIQSTRNLLLLSLRWHLGYLQYRCLHHTPSNHIASFLLNYWFFLLAAEGRLWCGALL